MSEPASKCARKETRFLRILHLSDTHNRHWKIEKYFPLPAADILLHTGDLTFRGTVEELSDVNEWFGTLKGRFKHIIVIAGNHDVHGKKKIGDMSALFTNATYLDHELAPELFNEFGLKVFGSPWLREIGAGNSGGEGHQFDLIPHGVDILMTHGPPKYILDTIGWGSRGPRHWGGSKDLNNAIYRAEPRVHVFGHTHEQRGFWIRGNDGYEGGVEYETRPGKTFPTSGPPPKDWPCDLVSCNAMLNHSRHEGCDGSFIAGPARLIFAQREDSGAPWRFSV